VIGPGDDGAQGDGQDVEQVVALGASYAEIGHLAQVFEQAWVWALGHAARSTGSWQAR
jgi:hypothetical protein